jgi:anti-sigma factor RsiW
MANDLDHMLARLAQEPPDASLEGVEATVMAAVARHRDEVRASRALIPIRAASVAMAMALGVTAGGIAAATTLNEPHRLDTFSTGAHLAPSTLLEGRG